MAVTLLFAHSLAAMIDDTESERAVAHDAAAVRALDKPYWLAGQCLGEIDLVVPPSNGAIRTDSPDNVFSRICRLAQHAVPAAWRELVMLGRRAVGEGRMRPLLVVQALKLPESVELLAQAARRRRSGVSEERQMQPLEPAVLLRLARLNALWSDARLDNLDRQPRQSTRSRRGEWRAIVRAQPHGQAVFVERRAQDRPDMIGVVPAQNLAAQEIPTVRIAQGQGLTMRAIAGQEPTFEVDTPYVVGAAARAEWRAGRRSAPTPLALHRQARAIEQGSNRARGWPAHGRIVPLQPGKNLRRSPCLMRTPDRKTAVDDIRRDCLRVRLRRTRPIAKTFKSVQPVSLQPLVASLARQAESPAH